MDFVVGVRSPNAAASNSLVWEAVMWGRGASSGEGSAPLNRVVRSAASPCFKALVGSAPSPPFRALVGSARSPFFKSCVNRPASPCVNGNGMVGSSWELDFPSLKSQRRPHYKQHAKRVAKMGTAELLDDPLMKLSPGQHQFFHELPSGLRMEVIVQRGETQESKTPLVFVHGSYHAAWCWACRWLPFFASLGHDSYAVSLVGQGASDVPTDTAVGNLESHATDIAHFIRYNLNAPPVLIGHSFGGLIVQWYFSQRDSVDGFPPSDLATGWQESSRRSPFPVLAAAGLVCSTPPTGNGPMVKRFMKRDLIASIKITLSLAAKLFGSSVSLCRESFFSPDMPEEDVRKYQKLLKESSRHPMIDLRKLNDYLPLPKLPSQTLPVFVLAAENDFVVDLEGSQETAEWYGTKPVVISGSGHDIMLDTQWEKAAQALYSWLGQQGL